MQSKCHLAAFALLAALWPALVLRADTLVLSSGRTHLRSGNVPEWTEFADQTPDGRRLDLTFMARSNATEYTLQIRQEDVRQDWPVQLNGKRLGKLFLMEADLVHTLAIAPGSLSNGENILSITPPRDNDDIFLYDIRIDSRPMTDVLHEATLNVRVTDKATGKEMPCRLTVVNEHGTLAAFIAPSNSVELAVRPGVAYTANGRAELGLPAGAYTVYATRGFEWSVATQRVNVAIGGTARLNLELSRDVPTPGWVSCDTHVHTFTYSRHGDATINERMVTLAGEGIELPIATDHNTNIDYAEFVTRTDTAEWFTPVTGNEITTTAGHFNIFPVEPEAPVPDFRLTDWPRLMAELRATPGVRVVVLNHPRNVHNNFQPFAATNFNAVTGDNLRGPEFTVDAMEVMNSSAQQSDFMLVYRDWFALLNHGYRITGVGSSDCHDVSRYIVGQGRTYIACADNVPGRLDSAAACSNLLAGRALVSMGLLVDMAVNEQFKVGDLATNLDGTLRVTVRVMAPPWSSATNVCLFANGLKVREEALAGAHISTTTWGLPRPAHDVHLVAIATGPGVTAPFWAIPRPYQPSSPRWESRVIASTNPIWVDGDGDGRFTSARGYAEGLVKESGTDAAKLISALNRFDEAVAVQAASLAATAGQLPDSSRLAEILSSAAGHVRRGFNQFAATQH